MRPSAESIASLTEPVLLSATAVSTFSVRVSMRPCELRRLGVGERHLAPGQRLDAGPAGSGWLYLTTIT